MYNSCSGRKKKKKNLKQTGWYFPTAESRKKAGYPITSVKICETSASPLGPRGAATQHGSERARVRIY